MKDIKAGLSKKLREDKKKVLLLGVLAVIILAFILFLTSLSSDEEPAAAQGTEAAQDNGASGALSLTPEDDKVPAAKRYDYTNLLEKNQTAPDAADDPFAAVREQAQADADAAEQVPGQEPEAQSVPEMKPTEGVPPAVQSWLYCDSYAQESQAQEMKALIAFQGVSSQVVRTQDGAFQLKVGPFPSREAGRSEFNRLGEAGLVDRCALVDEPSN